MQGGHGLTALLGDLVHGDRELAGMLTVDELDLLLDDGILRTVARGTRLTGDGHTAGSVFLVLHGRLREDEAGGGAELGPGDLLGTAGLLRSGDNAGVATALTSAILVQIPREVTGRVFERVPRLMQRLFQRCRNDIVARALGRAPVLSMLDAQALAELTGRATLSGHREGSDVVSTGDPGDTFHVIADGLAAVRHLIDSRPFNLALLREGDYFGEWSLLTGAPRAATVTALTRTITVGIDRPCFLQLVQQHPSVQQRIDLEARSRHERSIAFLARVESSDDVRGTLETLESIISEED